MRFLHLGKPRWALLLSLALSNVALLATARPASAYPWPGQCFIGPTGPCYCRDVEIQWNCDQSAQNCNQTIIWCP